MKIRFCNEFLYCLKNIREIKLLARNYSNCKYYGKVCLRGLQVVIIVGKDLQN